MVEHGLVLVVCLPALIALGAWNTRKQMLTPGEMRFWGVTIFGLAELVYLGMS